MRGVAAAGQREPLPQEHPPHRDLALGAAVRRGDQDERLAVAVEQPARGFGQEPGRARPAPQPVRPGGQGRRQAGGLEPAQREGPVGEPVEAVARVERGEPQPLTQLAGGRRGPEHVAVGPVEHSRQFPARQHAHVAAAGAGELAQLGEDLIAQAPGLVGDPAGHPALHVRGAEGRGVGLQGRDEPADPPV